MSVRARIIAFITVVAVAVAGLAAYLVSAHSEQENQRRSAPKVDQTTWESLRDAPRVVFRNTSLRDNYGDVAMVSLSDPGGPRALSTTSCDRVYATTVNVLCVASDAGLTTSFSAKIMDLDLHPTQDLPLLGSPSRARLSRDGKLAATTSFTSGDSYAGVSFSTRTVVSPVGDGKPSNLEDFKLVHNNLVIQPVDRNYWGVTFAADDNTFYATVKWSKTTWLIKGNLATGTAVTMQSDAECPSLSPDGKYLVYKQRSDLPVGQWRLVRYTIATGVITPLAETHSVDDQVEWLDDEHVMYGLQRSGNGSAGSDVWVVPSDGSGAPKLIIPEAWSPAVVR